MTRVWRWRRAISGLLLLCAVGAHAAEPLRVVALGGDITETIYALQAQSDLVGVDLTSQWPAAAHDVPNVGYVRQLAAEGILALRPNLVLATHDAGPPVVLRQLTQAGVRIEVLPEARDPRSVSQKIQQLGDYLQRPAAAMQLIARINAQYRDLARQVGIMPRHPRVVFLMSANAAGVLAAGQQTAADAAIRLAGGQNVGVGFHGYKPLSAEALLALAPDVILLMREGMTPAAQAALLQQPGVAATPAGRKHQLLLVDGQALLGFGPRNAAQELALQQRLAQLTP